jgi:hypothetical protein
VQQVEHVHSVDAQHLQVLQLLVPGVHVVHQYCACVGERSEPVRYGSTVGRPFCVEAIALALRPAGPLPWDMMTICCWARFMSVCMALSYSLRGHVLVQSSPYCNDSRGRAANARVSGTSAPRNASSKAQVGWPHSGGSGGRRSRGPTGGVEEEGRLLL